MKHQQVNVDFWAMGKSMLMYGMLTVAGWMIMRIFNAVFSLPRRMRLTQDNMQATLEDLQRRYPKLNITEEDMKEAEKEYEQWTKDFDEKFDKGEIDFKEKENLTTNDEENSSNDKEKEDDKKSI